VINILDAAYVSAITAMLTWGGQAWKNRIDAKRLRVEERTAQFDHDVKIETQRDELLIQLISNARSEVTMARTEMEDLRDQLKQLRAMEQHFYHFQQSIEHLEAIVNAETPEDRAVAERNAKSFLKRMQRLQDAKGTIANEVQRAGGIVRKAERHTGENDRD
jgi:hypothetical protein